MSDASASTSTREFRLAALGGGVTSLLWFASEFYSRTNREAFLLIPVSVVSVLLVLSWRRKSFHILWGYLSGAAPILMLPILVIGAFAAFEGLNWAHGVAEDMQRRPFEAAAWRANPEGSLRSRMVDDLMTSRSINRMTSTRVRKVLGPPSTNLGGSDCDLAYWLGARRGWLCLTVADGRVSGVKLREYHD